MKRIIIALAIILLLGAQVNAQEWDKSSLKATGTCAPHVLTVTVTNVGADMQGPTAWRFVAGGVVISDGTLQLQAGASIVLVSPPTDGRIDFSVDQRNGHPGQGVAFVRMNCEPATAVKLSTFATVGIDDGRLLVYVVLLWLALVVGAAIGAAIGVWLRNGISWKR